MQPQNTTRLLVIGGVLLLMAGIVYAFVVKEKAAVAVANFNECAEAGYPIMESYPRQCRTPDGKNFIEDIGGELDKDDLIRVSNPRPNTAVSSPLTVEGMARGTWYFEASFPVRLLDGNDKELAVIPAQAQSEWMTTEFVPFKATLTFTKPVTTTGTLVLQKDNPSGLPEHDDELRIPVRFSAATSGTPVVTKACVISGCSSQICADTEMVSTCEYRPEYACYKTAVCERQATGQCGWTDTAALRSCLNTSQ